MKQEMGNLERNIQRTEPRYAQDTERKLQEDARQYEARNPEVVSWIRDSISRIDHERLASAFQRIAGRGGELNREVGIVSAERTFVVGGKGIGAHSYIGRTNALRGDHFKELMRTRTLQEVAAVLFDAICHENAHATGSIDIQQAERGNVCISAGYEDVFINRETVLTPHHLINEGISELIGELAARIYLEEAPLVLTDVISLTAEEYDTYVREELTTGTELSISGHSLGAREFIYKLAVYVAHKESASTVDFVERLMKGFFKGGGFISELGLSLNENLGPNFVADLSSAKTRDDLARIEQTYGLPEVTKDFGHQTMSELKRRVQGA